MGRFESSQPLARHVQQSINLDPRVPFLINNYSKKWILWGGLDQVLFKIRYLILTPVSDTTVPKEGYYVFSEVHVLKHRNFESNQNKLLRRVTYSTLVATLTYVPTLSRIPLPNDEEHYGVHQYQELRETLIFPKQFYLPRQTKLQNVIA